MAFPSGTDLLGIPMRKFVLLPLLFALSCNAAAEWVRFGSSGDGNSTIYVSPSTIRVSGAMVKMWTLFDGKKQNTNFAIPFMSMNLQSEFDCKEERVRSLSQTNLSGNMGGGVAVYADSKPSPWRPFSPESIDEGLWKYACGRQ